jgi:uncharacterized protein
MDRLILEGDRGTRLEVEVGVSRRARMRGLRDREHLSPGHGLLLPNARSVHTFGMRFPIEVAFLDTELMVLAGLFLPPGKVTVPRLRARHVLECNPGEGPSRGERLGVAGEPPPAPIYSSLPPGR